MQQNPDRIAAPEEKSDNSPLKQAFGAGVFAEVVGDKEEDDHERRRGKSRLRLEIQAQMYRDTGCRSFLQARLSLAEIKLIP